VRRAGEVVSGFAIGFKQAIWYRLVTFQNIRRICEWGRRQVCSTSREPPDTAAPFKHYRERNNQVMGPTGIHGLLRRCECSIPSTWVEDMFNSSQSLRAPKKSIIKSHQGSQQHVIRRLESGKSLGIVITTIRSPLEEQLLVKRSEEHLEKFSCM